MSAMLTSGSQAYCIEALYMDKYGIGTVTLNTNLDIVSIDEENSDKLVGDLDKSFLEMMLPDDRNLIYEMMEDRSE